jgi:hypothetical protein
MPKPTDKLDAAPAANGPKGRTDWRGQKRLVANLRKRIFRRELLEPDEGKLCAVKTNKPNTCPRQEKPGKTLLGHRSYPNAKAHGDQSLIEKRETSEPAKLVVLQGSRDTRHGIV